ncbi:condensation domain-containing protein, partial [Crocosphaera watsonii]
CRYLGDGNIEYIGRVDHQVKIRGFRIELGEIENVLNTHSDIRENVVVVKEAQNGNKCLVAYLVPFQGIESTNKNNPNRLTQNLRRYLNDKLPSYMIPTMFILLDRLPLTPNGKVDHRALPIPDWNWFSKNEDFVLPNTPSQEIMVSIWQEVLKIDQISIKDNFFERGGHSLLATQVISRVREAFNIEIPIKTLFEFPTVEELSQKIDRVDDHRHSTFLTIDPISRERPLSLSFAQQRLWFLDQLEGKSATYNIPAALILEGQLNQQALEQSINTIIGIHESLRTRFNNVNGEVIQIIERERPISLKVINIEKLETNEQKKQVKLLALEEAQKPFNLTNDPLIRVSLIKLGVQSNILLITLHHIIFDAWSIGIFFRELAEFYAAYSQGKDINLPSFSIQYADYAAWQRKWLSGEAEQNQVNYWKKKLKGLPLLLEIPTDYPRPPVQTFQGTHQSFSLNQELSKKLKQLSQREGVTLFMLLLSAFAILLSRYSRQKDIAVGSPIANRNRSEIEPIIGFFVNTLLMRLNLEDSLTISQLLKQVRQTCLDAYAHQDIPFEKLVEELKPERNLSHTPLFQAMFALQNAPLEFKLPDLSVSLMEVESGIAKFDLSLSMEESEQGLIGNWEYNTDLFAQETISRMIGHFQVLLEEIVNNPGKPIDKLPILTNQEKQKILVEWNDTAAEYP